MVLWKPIPAFSTVPGLSAVFPTPQHGEALLAGVVPDVARGAGLLLAEGIRLLELRGVLWALLLAFLIIPINEAYKAIMRAVEKDQ